MTISWSQSITFCIDLLKATENTYTVKYHYSYVITLNSCSLVWSYLKLKMADALYIEKRKPGEGWILSDKL